MLDRVAKRHGSNIFILCLSFSRFHQDHAVGRIGLVWFDWKNFKKCLYWPLVVSHEMTSGTVVLVVTLMSAVRDQEHCPALWIPVHPP